MKRYARDRQTSLHKDGQDSQDEQRNVEKRPQMDADSRRYVRRASRIATEFGRYAVLVTALVVAAYPLFWMATTALKGPADAADWWGLPRGLDFGNFSRVWRTGEFLRYFVNSVVVTAAAVALTVAAAAPAGYCIARVVFRGRRWAFLVFVFGMMVPVHVTLIPLLKLMQGAGLYDTRAGLALVHAAFQLPIAIVIFAGFFREIPSELEDAAAIDGCGTWGTFLHVGLPLARPAVVGVAVLALVHVWNAFVLALVLLQDPAKSTLPLGVRNLRGEFGANVPLMAAALTVAVLPPLVVYALAQRHLVRGLTAGAVKG